MHKQAIESTGAVRYSPQPTLTSILKHKIFKFINIAIIIKRYQTGKHELICRGTQGSARALVEGKRALLVSGLGVFLKKGY
jgi:hypothetical protein